MTIIFLIKIFLAHLIGDFVLQPEAWVKAKSLHKIKSKFLYRHILVHTILLLIVLGFQPRYYLGILLIVITHFLIDLAKIYLQNDGNKRWVFFADQILHILVLLCTANIYFPFSFVELPFRFNHIILLATALVLVTIVAAVIMQVVISRWDKLEEEAEIKSEGLEKAGYYIGVLERLFVFGFIVLNHWEGVGFLLAAKSIFRFGDLSKAKDRKLTEYILIGTLISFGIAIAVAVGYLRLKEWILYNE